MQRYLMQALIDWKTRPSRMPLIVRGARQVGKTTLLRLFGKAQFEHVLEINFELQPEYADCFHSLQPQTIINAISSVSGQQLTANKSLLILDEIQECPNAIKALRYFKENIPELHVTAAGSLLEFTLREENFRMPVGRIESLYMKPLSFNEYLTARGFDKLQKYLQTMTLETQQEPAIIAKAEQLLREFFVTGGMPNVVANYCKHQDLQEVQLLQAGILDTYRRDFGKYARGARVNYLQKIFERAPGMIAQHFQYSKIDPNAQSRDLKPALEDLVDAGLVHQIYHTSASGLPLSATINEKKFKLLFLDVGLVKFTNQLDPDLMLQKDIMLINQGALAEQFVGQELLTAEPWYYPQQLFYWQREKTGSLAEVDYVINLDKNIIPMEVKAGKTGSMRSLQVFLNEKSYPFGVRLSMQPLSFNNRVLSVPLYMIHELPRLIRAI